MTSEHQLFHPTESKLDTRKKARRDSVERLEMVANVIGDSRDAADLLSGVKDCMNKVEAMEQQQAARDEAKEQETGATSGTVLTSSG